MPKVSEEHLRARRAQILDAAARCFARAGFHRTTIQDIAAESGFSAGLIYRYFADKDDMIVAIAGRWHESQARRLHLDGPGDPGDRGADAFRRVVAGYLDLLRSLAAPDEGRRVQLGVQIWAEALRAPQVHEVARQGVDLPRGVIAELVRAAQERGELPAGWPADGLARVFIAIYQGLALQTAWEPELDNAAFVETVQGLLDTLN
ncbi:TetR/AcrR family transcriptional regulator [Streptomyces sp. NPDC026673]|uniref:TetR/AcrR family transcriptional regulator n=1 Tax=Streptomyces sp. NPDC026673 TaxID=3155724 RepID=UPI0033D94378